MVHRTSQEIVKEVDGARKKIEVGGLYTHFKHPEQCYVVEFLGCLEETEVACVGYRALYGQGILWVRTVKKFLEKVEVNGKRVARFKKVKLALSK